MFCPKCKAEYRKGFTTCTECLIPLVAKLPPEPEEKPEYVKYVHLYSPQNAVELALLQSILDSENICYFVKNNNFGSLWVGPNIKLYNSKTIEVQDDQYGKAKELMTDYFKNTREHVEVPNVKYSIFDQIRMVIEFLLFT